jgi:hypothetical protein
VNRSFENVSQFKYLGVTATNQNLIKEEIKRRLNSGNACFHSVQNLLPSCLLSRNMEIRICKAINSVLRRIFGPHRDEIGVGWRKLHNEEFHNLYLFAKLIRMLKSRKIRWAWCVAELGDESMYIGYWTERQKKKDG